MGLLTFVSLFLRFYQLGKIPNGLTVDEADMGYNAYSILHTQKDVYGRKLPLFFQSLDDYKPGFAIYSTIPAIYIFGLSDFSIRFSPALLGSLTPILVFFLVRLLYEKKSKYLPAVAAILTAASPWNLAISRATLMYIDLIFFLLLAFVFFLLALKKNKLFLPISALFFSITLYVYYAAIIYLPFILMLLASIYSKQLLKVKKICFLSLVTLTIFSLPAVIHYLDPVSRSRLNSISVFTPDISLPVSISELQDDLNSGNSLFRFFHNRRFVFSINVLDNYADYYNLDYLFTNSHNVRYFYVNYIGLFYLIEFPLFLIGVVKLVTRRQSSDLFILGLLILGPLPASLTLGSPFPHRGILLLLSIELICAVGFFEAVNGSKFKYRNQLSFVLVATYLLNVIFFLHQYFVHSPKEFTTEDDNGAWFSTVRDVIPQVNQEKVKYDKVIFTWSKGKLVPPVYFLFYNKIDPGILQAKASSWKDEPPSYRQLYSQLGNIEFRPINWQFDKNSKNTLFVGYPGDFSSGINKYASLPFKENHFIFVKTN